MNKNTDQIKITRQQEKVLKGLLKVYDNEKILEFHTSTKENGHGSQYDKSLKCLNDLSVYEMARILIDGYEVVEETCFTLTEEKRNELVEWYKHILTNTPISNTELYREALGTLKGIERTLHILGVHIEEIQTRKRYV